MPNAKVSVHYSVGEPTTGTYLGTDIKKYYLSDNPETVRWFMSDKYPKHGVKEVKLKLGEIDRKLITRAVIQFASGYHPEMDVTPEITPSGTTISLTNRCTAIGM
jgi:hypothetical protein